MIATIGVLIIIGLVVAGVWYYLGDDGCNKHED